MLKVKLKMKLRIFALLTICYFNINFNQIFAQNNTDDFDYDDDEDLYTLNIYILNEGSVRVFESGSAIEGGTGQEFSDSETFPSDLSTLHLFVKPNEGMTLDMLVYDDGTEEFMEWEGESEEVKAPGWEGWYYLGNDITPSGDVTINAVFATDLSVSSISNLDCDVWVNASDKHLLYYINGTPCHAAQPTPGYYITIDNGNIKKILIR